MSQLRNHLKEEVPCMPNPKRECVVLIQRELILEKLEEFNEDPPIHCERCYAMFPNRMAKSRHINAEGETKRCKSVQVCSGVVDKANQQIISNHAMKMLEL